METIDLRPSREMNGIDIMLESGGAEIRGIVRDLSGGAIEGARLLADRAFARSDAEGVFSMWVPPGLQSVVADAEGYASATVEGLAPGHTFELFLTPESVLMGKVVRADTSEPIEGAMVKAGAQAWGHNHSALTDSGGNFRIDGLEPGAYKPVVEADDARGSAVEQVILGIGEVSTSLRIEVHPAYSVDGRIVVSAAAGCAHGWLLLQDHAAGRGGDASVEGDGNVHVPALLPGKYAVTVGCEGHLSAESYDPIVILDKSQSDLEWTVSSGQTIRGQVVEANGTPVAGIEVHATQKVDPSRPRLRQTRARATTDADGGFALSGLVSAQFSVVVVGNRATPNEPMIVTLVESRDVNGVRIELPGSGEVRGKLSDERGQGMARSTVSLRGETKSFVGMVADDGSFSIEHVAVGTYEVLAEGRGGELRPPNDDKHGALGKSVEVQSGVVTTINLVVEANSGTISGYVRDADGGPVNDAFIEAIREPEGESEGTAMRSAPWGDFFGTPHMTEADGSFSLTGLPSSKHTLRAFRKGGGEGFVNHVEPGEDIVVTIAWTGRLAGTVHVPGGAAPEEFALEVVDIKTGYRRRDTFFRTGGTWSVPELPAGRYKIRVRMGAATAEHEALVSEGEDTSGVRIELMPKVSVRGSVLDIAGEPIPGVQVVVRAMEGVVSTQLDAERRHVTDSSGRFELMNVPTGDAEIILTSPTSIFDGTVESKKIPITISGITPIIDLAPIKIPRDWTSPGSADR